ncbi:MAG: isoleucine--tRNA ligase [Phycisphaerae bacterium]|nr:isoleucine--tRNA ligase [Phycisphaerae bacterium]
MMGDKKKSYKDTLNLPNTSFDMRAGLLKKEPAIQEQWWEEKLYETLRIQRKGCPRFILHDGPPYANGSIHIGHTLNKVLKDMVVRLKNMTGYDAPFIPGWDCHGLPIEAKVMEQLGEKAKTLEPITIRRICREYAEKYVHLQSGQFQRLGIMGEFEHPYITMTPLYEAEVLDVFARLLDRGLVFRQLKPVHWSIANQTALAEAELEYHDREDTSIYVAFEVETGMESVPHTPGDRLMLLIWTTTPWTLPANRAVAVHPQHDYTAVHVETPNGPATVIMATERLEAATAAAPEWFKNHEVVGTCKGQALADAKMTYSHPLTDEMSCPVVAADYVTLEDGTGMVHVAPGHGTEDYFVGLKNDLEIYCPVTADGTFDETAPEFIRSLSVWDANPKIIEHIRNKGDLAAAETIVHSYPHDWRSKTPTIFRATDQWFVGVDRPLNGDDVNPTLRQMALDVCGKNLDDGGVDFIPEWGRTRLCGMLESRPDWCISRQRCWGLPIPAFYNEQGHPLCTPASVRAVAQIFAIEGSDAWFLLSPEQLLKGYDPQEDPDLYEPGNFSIQTLTKGYDIFDVWFESGSSWSAVAQQRGLVQELPVDMYLEGSDQHRGWFQLSLLPALGAAGSAPFKTVLTHGFINDDQGKKMSKSLGNTVDVQEQLTKRGADILRLWVASQDYQNDDRCSDAIIAQCEDTYRKIRNTIRFCLGSIDDYNPEADAAEPAEHSIDLWMRMELAQLVHNVRTAYDKYEFHRASRMIYEFCTIQASSVYLSATKDRLYCETTNSPRRRATQGVIREMVIALVKLLAPILPHTAEEAWRTIPNKPADWPQSIHMAALPDVDEVALRLAGAIQPVSHDFMMAQEREITVGPAWIWERLMDLRGEGLVMLEALKNEGVKNSLDAEAVFTVPANLPMVRTIVERYLTEMEDLLGVGYARIEEGPEIPVETVKGPKIGTPLIQIEVHDAREKYPRCQRSWKRRPDVGSDSDYPEVSARDAEVLKTQQ